MNSLHQSTDGSSRRNPRAIIFTPVILMLSPKWTCATENGKPEDVCNVKSVFTVKHSAHHFKTVLSLRFWKATGI